MTRRPRRDGAAPPVIAFLIAALLLAGCGAGTTPAPSTGPSPSGSVVPAATATPTGDPTPSPVPATTFPVTLTDDEGTSVTLEARPERIVSLTPATTEILFAVGAGPRVVGAGAFDDYPPEALPLPDVATYQSVDVEAIVGLEADLVLAGGNSFNSPDALARLRDLGIPVVVVYAPDVKAVLKDIELVATAAGEGPAGAALAASMRADIEAITGALATGGTRPRVFYELDATQEIYGPADDSFVAEMIELAGGEAITTGSPTVFSIPLETLIAADPEVIVLGDAAYGVTADQVAARPGWDAMTAVKEGAVRPVNDIIVTRPGPRLVEGLRALALAINPAAPLPPAGAGSGG